MREFQNKTTLKSEQRRSLAALMRARPRGPRRGGAYMTTGNRPASGAPLVCVLGGVEMKTWPVKGGAFTPIVPRRLLFTVLTGALVRPWR